MSNLSINNTHNPPFNQQTFRDKKLIYLQNELNDPSKSD